jgi:hypothetical protein
MIHMWEWRWRDLAPNRRELPNTVTLANRETSARRPLSAALVILGVHSGIER